MQQQYGLLLTAKKGLVIQAIQEQRTYYSEFQNPKENMGLALVNSITAAVEKVVILGSQQN